MRQWIEKEKREGKAKEEYQEFQKKEELLHQKKVSEMSEDERKEYAKILKEGDLDRDKLNEVKVKAMEQMAKGEYKPK